MMFQIYHNCFRLYFCITVTFELLNMALELHSCITRLYNLLLLSPDQQSPPSPHHVWDAHDIHLFPGIPLPSSLPGCKMGLRRSKVNEQCLQRQDLPRWTTHVPGRFVAVEALVRQASPANR